MGLESSFRGMCVFPNILDLLDKDLHRFSKKDGWEFTKAREAASGARLLPAAKCTTHGSQCSTSSKDGDVSGSPCVAWSSANADRPRHSHPAVVALLAWIQIAMTSDIKFALHENVRGLDVDMLREMVRDKFLVHVLKVEPKDAGFMFMRRPRLFPAGALRAFWLGPSIEGRDCVCCWVSSLRVLDFCEAGWRPAREVQFDQGGHDVQSCGGAAGFGASRWWQPDISCLAKPLHCTI